MTPRLWPRFLPLRQGEAGLIKGKTIGVDSTTLEAHAAMKSIVRRDTGEGYMAYLKAVRHDTIVAHESGGSMRGQTADR